MPFCWFCRVAAHFLIYLTGMSGLQSPLGESMNVVVEKRLSELQEEYDKMKTTWIDPELHHKMKKELETVSQANQTIEV